MKPKRKPFQSWRVLAQSGSQRFAVESVREHTFGETVDLPEFDEVVVSEPFIHIERMDTRSAYVGLGDVKLNVRLDRNGKTRVVLYDGDYDPTTGELRNAPPALIAARAALAQPTSSAAKKPRRKR